MAGWADDIEWREPDDITLDKLWDLADMERKRAKEDGMEDEVARDNDH